MSSSSNITRKIHACWLGKAIGGTLGAPFEGQRGPLDLSFYDPVPTQPLPNDDLDLQVVWLYHLRSGRYREVTPQILAEAWQRHVLFPFDEYAIARRNHGLGLSGPLQGATDNYFGECMGGAIRSEVWACIAPGEPARAAGFAWADAVVDHAGEGVWAEVFNAALQSAAFVEHDRQLLIDVGLGFLPGGSRLRRAIEDTCRWWEAHGDWRHVRSLVMERYETGNFTDVVCNICFQLIGWFDGGSDFGRAICTAVNCGLDTDCTGATLGATLGILDPDTIPEGWRKPIGERVVLSDPIVFVPAPEDISELTEWTIQVAEQLRAFSPRIGEVISRRPANRLDAVQVWHGRTALVGAGEAASAEIDSPADLQGAKVETTIVYGAWSQWPRASLGSDGRLLEITFEVVVPGEYKLMVYGRSGIEAWIDDERVLRLLKESVVSDVFCAPSFHRAGPAATVLPPLAVGLHKLSIWIKVDTEEPLVDLIWGFADPVTNLWTEGIRPAEAEAEAYLAASAGEARSGARVPTEP